MTNSPEHNEPYLMLNGRIQFETALSALEFTEPDPTLIGILRAMVTAMDAVGDIDNSSKFMVRIPGEQGGAFNRNLCDGLEIMSCHADISDDRRVAAHGLYTILKAQSQ